MTESDRTHRRRLGPLLTPRIEIGDPLGASLNAFRVGGVDGAEQLLIERWHEHGLGMCGLDAGLHGWSTCPPDPFLVQHCVEPRIVDASTGPAPLSQKPFPHKAEALDHPD